jgi:hypothetical protein
MTNTIPLEYCTFNKETGVLVVASEFFAGSFPTEVSIKSTFTGNVVRFVKDEAAAIAAEFWDGEMCEYVPIDPVNNCKRLVVIHEY